MEMVIHEFCDKLQIPFEKISSEDFSAFLRILSLSKMLKNPNNMRGKSQAAADTTHPDVQETKVAKKPSTVKSEWLSCFPALGRGLFDSIAARCTCSWASCWTSSPAENPYLKWLSFSSHWAIATCSAQFFHQAIVLLAQTL